MYEGQDFATFMYTVCNAYPNVETVIEKLTDYVSEEYKAFHAKTVSEHITLIWIQQRGKTYQVSRVSNIRNTTGLSGMLQLIGTPMISKSMISISPTVFTKMNGMIGKPSK